MIGKGERGEGDEGWGWGRGVKVQKYINPIQCRSGEIFFRAKNFFLLMTIADSLLLGKSATGQNFYQDSGPSPLAD